MRITQNCDISRLQRPWLFGVAILDDHALFQEGLDSLGHEMMRLTAIARAPLLRELQNLERGFSSLLLRRGEWRIGLAKKARAQCIDESHDARVRAPVAVEWACLELLG